MRYTQSQAMKDGLDRYTMRRCYATVIEVSVFDGAGFTGMMKDEAKAVRVCLEWLIPVPDDIWEELEERVWNHLKVAKDSVESWDQPTVAAKAMYRDAVCLCVRTGVI